MSEEFNITSILFNIESKFEAADKETQKKMLFIFDYLRLLLESEDSAILIDNYADFSTYFQARHIVEQTFESQED